MELLAHLRPSAPFKTRWQYNNIAYSSAAQVPRQLFDESFEDFVAENIWNPLGMTRSHYDVSIAKATNHLASGFGRRVAPGRMAKLQDVEACEGDVQKRGGRLSDECRGEQQDLGWSIKHWRGIAGAGGVITCAKDMVSENELSAPTPQLTALYAFRPSGCRLSSSRDSTRRPDSR